jgi:NADPH:quinone reductase-like Zn-dependent oxidoreductase
MHAAVVRSFGAAPRWEPYAEPVARAEQEVVLDVVAAGLHPRVRSSADGSHYTSDGVLPLVPGVDGVGRAPDGTLLYVVADGTMAERVVADRRRAVPLPAGTDPVAVAAGLNPAMSSWVALRRRAGFAPGQSVLVLGATGNAGRLAVEIAGHLGAGRVVSAGRDAGRLARIGGGVTLEEAGRAAADVDVVLDYVWAEPAARVMRDLLTARPDRAKPLVWVQIGATAGPDLTLPSAVLRAAAVQVMGSGQGSVRTADIVAELPALVDLLPALTIDPDPRPLRTVEQAWTEPTSRRVVLTA